MCVVLRVQRHAMIPATTAKTTTASKAVTVLKVLLLLDIMRCERLAES